jgi:hypothetical protein
MSSSNDVPVLDPNIITELRQMVTAYHEVDTSIKAMQVALQDKKKVKQTLSTRICEIMHSLGLEDIKYSNSMLRYTTRKVTLQPTRATIKERLETLFPEKSQKEHAMQVVLAPRGMEERVGIRKVRIRT